MELYEEKEEKKEMKVSKILKTCIVVLIILTVLIVMGIIFLKSSITIIQVDGERNYKIEEILYIESTENGKELYIPIIKMAEYLGYEGFSGDYKDISEDKTKCHITSENETTMFTLNSDVLVKISKDSEMEYIALDKPVFEKDGELYTTIYGIQKALNVLFSYNNNFKKINIYSMDHLINSYAKNLNIKNYSIDFNDRKAILENMMIIQKDSKYGVINIAQKGKSILETKYDEIKYLPATSCFIVKSNGKYGIMTNNAEIKVKMIYDEIKTIDNKNGLYLVKQNNTYGVINISGDVIIKPEYKSIGINIQEYAQNEVENAFVLLDEIIPVKNSQDLWGLFNLKGEQITDFKYTGLGCTSSSAINSYSVLTIPEHKIIVVKQNEYYNLITSEGEQLIQDNRLNSVYKKMDAETEKNQFFMTYNNNQKVINIKEWLASKEG